MKFEEIIKCSGEFIINSRDRKTGIIKEVGRIKNMIMDTVLDQLALSYSNFSPDLEIKYLAIGDGDTAVESDDSTLDSEVFRTFYDSKYTSSEVGRVYTDFWILGSDYSGAIEEIGIFGGSGATASTDSGTLMSRVLWSYTKSSSEDLYINRVDTIAA